jgi:signal transduction protein with GAF and PtsI domain
MKKRFLIIMLMLAVVATAYAQGGGQRGGQRPDPKVQAKTQADTWQEKFALSDEQHTKVYDLLLSSAEKRQEKMQALRNGGQPDRTAMQKMMTEFQEEQDKELKKIFSATQWTAYETWKKENPPRQGRGGGQD